MKYFLNMDKLQIIHYDTFHFPSKVNFQQRSKYPLHLFICVFEKQICILFSEKHNINA